MATHIGYTIQNSYFAHIQMAYRLTPEHGRAGGTARAKAMTKAERSEASRQAAVARWKKVREDAERADKEASRKGSAR